ncbi:AraC family transcriptional regulator [Pseudomonas sp. IT-194MI4]
MKTHRIAGHHFRDLFIRVVDQKALDRQHALEHAVVIDHEQFVGMAWQLFETTQVTQHHFKTDILTDRHHLEVHQRTDLLLVIGQRGADALTLLSIEGFHQLVDDVSRQLGGQVSKFVGIHVLGRRQELVIVHVGDQGFTNRIGYFEQNVAVAVGLDQLPDGQTIVQWQGFKDVGNVSGVQIIELALQLDEVLPVNQVLDPVVMRTFLAMSQVFDHPLALQQLNDLSKAVLQAFLRFLYFNFRHRRTPLPAAGHAGRINQSIHDCKNGVLSNYWVSPWRYSTSPGGADRRNDNTA